MSIRAVLLLALLVAGCTSTKPSDPAPGSTMVSATSFTPVSAIAGCSNCWEPAVTVDTAGRIFAVTGFDHLLAVSNDGGRTFTQSSPPPLPAAAPTGVVGDAIVDAGPDGRVYYVAFIGRLDTGILPIPEGMHVASSADGGKTWDANTYLSILDDPNEIVVTPWKSWFAFGDAGEVYVAYALRPGGIWVARSDDHAATFGAWTLATPPPDRLQNAFIGYPAVLPDGRLIIPHWGDQLPGLPPPFAVTSHALRLAVSDDGGATFRAIDVETAMPPTALGRGFPVLAEAGAALFLAYEDFDQAIQVRTSHDRGETWSESVMWSGGRASGFGVWAAASNDALSVLFIDDETGDLRYAKAPLAAAEAGPTEQGVVAADVGVTGDFPHFDLLPDGRMAVVWSDLASTVFVGVGP